MDELAGFFVVDLALLSQAAQQGLLLVSIGSEVYDVTSSYDLYGPKGAYSAFAGNKITRALGLDSKLDADMTDDLSGLSSKQLDNMEVWLAFFRLKYPRVGTLKGGLPVPFVGECPLDHGGSRANRSVQVIQGVEWDTSLSPRWGRFYLKGLDPWRSGFGFVEVYL